MKGELHKDISLDIQAMDFSNSGSLDIENKIVELWRERDFEKEYLITYTSGTTGIAKGVSNSFANLLGTGYAFCDKTNVVPESRFLHIMPMTYMAGILNSITYPFIAGLKIVLCQRFSVNVALRFWNIVSKQEITNFWLSPAMVMMIDQLDKGDKGVDFCSKHDMVFSLERLR